MAEGARREMFESALVKPPKRGLLWVTSRLTGAFVCGLMVFAISLDAGRPVPIRPLSGISSVIDGEIASIMSGFTGAGPSGSSQGVSSMTVGVVGTVGTLLMRARGVSIDTAGAEILPGVIGLVVARNDGTLGPYLVRSPVDCAPGGESGLPCDWLERDEQFTLKNVTLPELADQLADELNAVVVDRTGIVGRFNVTLRWRPRDGGSIFVALREQLGLKLVVETSPTASPSPRQ